MWFTPHECPQQPDLSRDAGAQLHAGAPRGGQGAKDLSHSLLLPPREQEADLGVSLSPGVSTMTCRHSKWPLSHCASGLPLSPTFLPSPSTPSQSENKTLCVMPRVCATQKSSLGLHHPERGQEMLLLGRGSGKQSQDLPKEAFGGAKTNTAQRHARSEGRCFPT